ncbi:MAG: hypothetical protein EZS26_003240 [Candidatus Ordinivivax streblomastigis]|uniref:DUF5000 domain-containing protein n=1 Tax=Candidatus Ordinivivax streblomastigis TaxID=2540710 RepID=A0A5M8NW61_9BACT|nr:MAG: hypothetical protein EZS26_003240 [Candidatus Ordinivivax streblomastigis]
MKRINFKYSLKTGIKAMMVIVPICLLVFVFSCENMNSIHEQYINRGETIYIGAADSVLMHPGYHKIGFEWKINADPRIIKAVIYWNERADTTTIPVVRTPESEGEMWLEALLEDIPEGEYVFEFELQDNSGNISKSLQISGTVLGDVYVENLRNRGIKELAKLVTGNMQITWEAVSATAATLQNSVVEYIDIHGNAVRREVPNDEEVTLLEGLETGNEVEIYTIHLPENGLEPFESIKRKFFMPKFEREISKSRFVAAFKPGDNTTPHPGGGDQDYLKPITDFGVGQRSLAKIWDGGSANNTNNATILHTEDQTNNADARFKFPHHFTIDLGVQATLSRIHIWCRTDNGAFTGHSPRFFELWATDAPKELGDFNTKDEFETYYRTTYVEQKDPANYLASGDAAYTDKLTQAAANSRNYVAPKPAQGINNWQKDWIKLGDFEIDKPSMSNFNTSNDADKAAWAAGADFNLNDVGEKVKYIRLVLKYPNWQNTNCINLGEITLYGDDI